MSAFLGIIEAFLKGWRNGVKPSCKHDKAMRANLSEKQLDAMVRDSFPASDPPSTY